MHQQQPLFLVDLVTAVRRTMAINKRALVGALAALVLLSVATFQVSQLQPSANDKLGETGATQGDGNNNNSNNNGLASWLGDWTRRPAVDVTMKPKRKLLASAAGLGVQTCTPATKWVYIKTHKTGSSTIANMFHRFGNRHGLKLALPRDDTFYAWPNLDTSRIIATVWQRKTSSQTYDMLCSAHVRYNRAALDSLVPDAKYLTVLRSPLTHVKSSYSYWGVSNHIRQNGGPSLSLDQFLENPTKYFQVANRGDYMLLKNSQCFDLGLSNEPSESQVRNLMKEMDESFFVLITDHMDESLVLLKRMYCWDFEDIVYISLKSRTKTHTSEPDATVQLRERRIREMNPMDQMLFDHFNETLWKLIKQDPGFDEDLKRFEEYKHKMSMECSQYAGISEAAHRRFIEEGSHISEIERLCHLILLDSQSFSKHMKWKQHADPTDVECLTQGFPRKSGVLEVTPDTGSDVVVSLLIGHAIRHNLPIGLPAAGAAPDSVRTWTAPVKSGTHAIPKLSFVVGRPDAAMNMRDARAMVNDRETTMVVLRDPVLRFLELWEKYDGEMVTGVSLKAYVASPTTYASKFSTEQRENLHFGQSKSLGFKSTSITPSDPDVNNFVRMASQQFQLWILTDRLAESLVYYRRYMCFGKADTQFMLQSKDFPTNPSSRTLVSSLPVTASLRTAIQKIVPADYALYSVATQRLNNQISREMSFDVEVNNLMKDADVNLSEQCAHMLELSKADLVQKARTLNEDRQCAMMLLGANGLKQVLMSMTTRYVYTNLV
eukprot:m.359653 g.359653  ORF g.359653 m.359653 type:complete len:775 (-) comp18664_c0_seq1:1572-3896(-)